VVHALVPLKDLVSAKTRLSGVLRPAERRALAQAMVEDVLTALTAHGEIDRVTLVSDDPGADLLACKYGVEVLEEQSLGCRGLNAVVSKSCDLLMNTPGQVSLVLHGDLPLLCGEDLDAVLKLQARCKGLVIGTDLQNEGTNLLAFDSSCRPDFAFGPLSCDRHRASAKKLGIEAVVLRTEGIGLDVDQAADLSALLGKLRKGGSGHTAKLLLHTELGDRIDALLASLDGPEIILRPGETIQ
jgi:2-phospho-L-lactate/phosphoenolpyruvate guanylyltransferase